MRKELLAAILALCLSLGCFPVPARTLVGDYVNVVPYANDTYNVGSPTRYWNNGYFDNLFVNSLSGIVTGGNVTGTGSNNKLAYWTSPSSIGNSSIHYNISTGRYGVGTPNPELMLHLHNGGAVADGIQLSYTTGALYSNITNDMFGYLRLMPSGGRVGINDLTPSYALDVNGSGHVDTLQVGSATPIFPLYSGSQFASQIQVNGTAILKSQDWSVSQLNYGNSATIPEHTGTGSYDYTGNTTAERLFYATAPIFDETDDDGKMILLMGGTHVGAVVEIEHYISSTEVQVTSDNGWTSDVTSVAFGILPTPTFGVANSGSARFSMGGESTLAMMALNATSFAPVSVQVINGGNDISAFEVDVINGGYKHNEAIDINYVTGNMTADMHASILKVSVDKSGASSSTNTTELDFINIGQVGKNSSQSHAIHVGQGFDTALAVSGGTRIDPSYGYTVTAAHAVTDRVTGVAPGGTAFLDTSAGNVQMFVADDDYILLGSSAAFESIPVYLNVTSSHTIAPTFFYSTGIGTWATLVVSDTTNGFTNNGIISFNAPAAWTATNKVTPAGASITSGFYVKIVRTRNTITTPPTENYFKLYTSSSATDFLIRGNGTVRPVRMADVSAPNDSIYYSTTANKLVYKDSSGVVNNLY